RGERLETDRPQQERRRQLLHAIDEDKNGRRPQCRREQRQMDAPHRPGSRFPKAARRAIEAQRNLRKTRFDPAGGNRQKADRIGDNQRRARTRKQKSRTDAEYLTRYAVERVVERGKRDKQADRKYRARNRIAQTGDPRRAAREPATVEP